MPSQQRPVGPQYPSGATGQHTPPHETLHVSMMVPDEFRVTALQCSLHPTCCTIDRQAALAWSRVHPDSVQSVPTLEFGLSQKLRVTLQLFGVIAPVDMPSASVVMPSGSSVVSFGDADGASGFPGVETALVSLLGSGVDSDVHAHTVMSDARAKLVIRLKFLMESSYAQRSGQRERYDVS
jgi:hypothetical protein